MRTVVDDHRGEGGHALATPVNSMLRLTGWMTTMRQRVRVVVVVDERGGRVALVVALSSLVVAVLLLRLSNVSGID
jgi:hypothetical protein